MTCRRWRPAHFWAEIYWMGGIDHDDVPRRRYDEATQFFGEMNRLAPAVLGALVRMDVGIAGANFDNKEAHKTYPMGVPSPMQDAVLLHRQCYQTGIAGDYGPYRALADEFKLTAEQRSRLMENGKVCHWENRVQWARNKLVSTGIMAREPRGVWSLAKS